MQQARHGKFLMEMCQTRSPVQTKKEFVRTQDGAVQLTAFKMESEQEIIQRLRVNLTLTQREVESLKSDVEKLKSEQKGNEQLIQRLQQANKGLYHRLDELQSRCDSMEDQTRKYRVR